MAVVECELHLDDEGGADRLPGMPLVGLFWDHAQINQCVWVC